MPPEKQDNSLADRLVVPVERLRWHCDPDGLGFKTTEQIAVCTQILGQRRAVDALRLGLEIQGLGYNIFVSGPVGTGRTTTVKCLLEETEKNKKTPDDKCYVNNFSDPDQPTMIRLPAGQGRKFQKDMDELVEYLAKNTPLIFESENYERRKNEIVENFKTRSTARAREFERKVGEAGFALLQATPVGKPELVPVVDGKPSSMEDLHAAVDEGRAARDYCEKLSAKYHALQDELNVVVKEMRANERAAREALVALDKDMVRPLVHERLTEIRDHHKHETVSEYLDEIESAVLEEPSRFHEKAQSESPPAPGWAGPPFLLPGGDPYLEFRVNVLVDNTDEKDAPVIFETSPSYKNLFGTIERIWDRSGQWRTDFTKIKAGSILRADGGFLVMNALDLFAEPAVWPTLKRTLRNRAVEIQSYDPYSMLALSAIKPEPIEVDVKVVLIGDPEVYEILYANDDEFPKLFKIRSDFDWETKATPEGIRQYASLIKTLCGKEDLRPFDSAGVAAVVEFSARLAGRANKLSTRFNIIADLLKEADYWAGKDGAKLVQEQHVDRAIDERIDRASLIEEKIQDMIDQGLILIATEGRVIGQVNGLAVYDTGELTFGKPSRITAKVSVGSSGIINIEREAQMSGRIHDKGVLILAGYLRDRFAQDKPLAMSASICFEQSYSGVEGDSASSTEVYALLSALSGLPIRQDLAVTGSVNQKGEIQPIGGVNQKIEGFYDVCKSKGLTGTQGVIVPIQNTGDLMLRKDVVEVVRAGEFRVFAVKSIDEGIELLTGVPAGVRGRDGKYPEGTVYWLVDKRLEELARIWRSFQHPPTFRTAVSERPTPNGELAHPRANGQGQRP
jgi:ATP-dependent Lon protease